MDVLGSNCSFTKERTFVDKSVCSPFWEGLFAIWLKCSEFCLKLILYNFIGIPLPITSPDGGERGTKIVKKRVVNKLTFPNFWA